MPKGPMKITLKQALKLEKTQVAEAALERIAELEQERDRVCEWRTIAWNDHVDCGGEHWRIKDLPKYCMNCGGKVSSKEGEDAPEVCDVCGIEKGDPHYCRPNWYGPTISGKEGE